MQKEALENMDTPELDAQLQAELRREVPDEKLVTEILQELKDREKDLAVEVTPEMQAAFDKFNGETQRRSEQRKPARRNWLLKVAASSLAAVLAVLRKIGSDEEKKES